MNFKWTMNTSLWSDKFSRRIAVQFRCNTYSQYMQVDVTVILMTQDTVSLCWRELFNANRPLNDDICVVGLFTAILFVNNFSKMRVPCGHVFICGETSNCQFYENIDQLLINHFAKLFPHSNEKAVELGNFIAKLSDKCSVVNRFTCRCEEFVFRCDELIQKWDTTLNIKWFNVLKLENLLLSTVNNLMGRKSCHPISYKKS